MIKASSGGLITDHLRRHYRRAEPECVGEAQGIKVLRVRDCPVEGISTYLTEGLNKSSFTQRESGRLIRQELLLSCLKQFESDEVPAILLATAILATERNLPLLRGELVWPLDTMFLEFGGRCVGLLFDVPGYFSDDFLVVDAAVPVVFVELFPLTEAECRFAEHYGVDELRDRIEAGSIDPLDHARAS